ASIAMFDANMKYIAASRRYMDDYRLSRRDIVGKSHYDVFPEISDRWKEIHRRCLEGAIEKAEADPFPRQDGSIDWVRWEIHPWYEQGGKIGGIFLFSEVITERILAENKIKQFNQQLRALTSHVESIREEERSNLAREIHDVLGQMLTAIKIDVNLLSTALAGKGYEAAHLEFEDLQKIVDKTIQIVRNIATELRPPVLSLGIVPAIEWQTREFEKRFHIPCDLQIDIPEIALEEKLSNTIFRTLQEALTNVLRHAKATRIKIQLTKAHAHLVLRIIDNGRGIENAEIENVKSLGLLGMKERALMIGGKLTIEGTHGSGTSVTLEVPFQN
ncbi:PAS domain-containing protein, partial [bacterium]|nr:PAS domain-containing protein [bacterium]